MQCNSFHMFSYHRMQVFSNNIVFENEKKPNRRQSDETKRNIEVKINPPTTKSACRPLTSLEFVTPRSSEELDCWTALSFWPMDCARDHILQALMPSDHVCSMFELPALPQVLNHEPPRPQQLGLPDFSIMPHWEHTELMAGVVVAGVYCENWLTIQR